MVYVSLERPIIAGSCHIFVISRPCSSLSRQYQIQFAELVQDKTKDAEGNEEPGQLDKAFPPKRIFPELEDPHYDLRG